MKKKISTILILTAALAMGACGNNEKTYTQSEVDKLLEASSKSDSSESSSEESTATQSAEAEKAEKKDESKKTKAVSSDLYTTNEEIDMFASKAAIEEVVLVDEENIKITATDISYGNSAKINLLIENNSDKDVSVISGSSGYNWNSVNGYMVDSAYINADVPAGKSSKETVSLNTEELMILGIRDLYEIDLAFEVKDADYNVIFDTEPKAIKTSIYEEYDSSKESFKDAIRNEYIANEISCDLRYYSDDVLFESNDVSLITSTMAMNSSEEEAVIFEFSNNSENNYVVQASNIAVNGIIVSSSGNWTSTTLSPKKNGLMTISLDSVVDPKTLEKLGISEIDNVSMEISLADSGYEEIESKEINISFTGNDSSAEIEGTEVLNENGIRIISVGKMEDPSDYSEDIHFLFVIENNYSESVVSRLDYSGNSINGYVADLLWDSKTIPSGGKALMDVYLFDSYKEDCNVNSIEDVTDLELKFELETENYDSVVESTVAVSY